MGLTQWLTACPEAPSASACVEGTEACACAGGRLCDPGLACDAGVCVVAEGPNASTPDAAVVDLADEDTTAAADSAQDEASRCSAEPAADFCRCRGNDDCASGYCLPSSAGGSVCTRTCDGACPDGYDCLFVALPNLDPTYLCVEPDLNLCRPCTDDAECQRDAVGAVGARCVRYSEAKGSFCGKACGTDTDCPTDYACREVESLETGILVRQCVLADPGATCTCSGRSIEGSAFTTCAVDRCEGTRLCEDAGLTACVSGDGTPCAPSVAVTVTFDPQAGALSGAAVRTVFLGEPYGPLPEATREGYDLSSWRTAPAGAGEPVTAEALVTTREAHTLFAAWSGRRFVVTFDAAGGSACEPRTVTFGAAYGADGALCSPTRPGFGFAGWRLGEGAAGEAVTDASLVATARNHTLTATWAASVLTVSFDSEGGSPCDSRNVTFGAAYGAAGPLCTPTRPGFAFAGWFDGDNGTGTLVTADSAVASPSDHELYARWTANTYAVTFDAGEGTPATPPGKDATFGSPYGDLATTSRVGYTLAGWRTLPDGDGTLVRPDTEVTRAEPHTLYAAWSPNSYTVSFDSGGGTTCAPLSVTFGASYGDLCQPARVGYRFGGWWTAASNGTLVTAETAVTIASDHVLEARWLEADCWRPLLEAPLAPGLPANALQLNGAWLGHATSIRDARPCLLQRSDWNQTHIPAPRASRRYERVRVDVHHPGTSRTGFSFVARGDRVGYNTVEKCLVFAHEPSRHSFGYGDAGDRWDSLSVVSSAPAPLVPADRWTTLTWFIDRTVGTFSFHVDDRKVAEGLPIPPRVPEGGSVVLYSWGVPYAVSPDVCWSNLSVHESDASADCGTTTVTWDPNGGTPCADGSSRSVAVGEIYGEPPCEPSRAGHRLVGWFTAASGGERVTASTVLTSTIPHTLYARWEALPEAPALDLVRIEAGALMLGSPEHEVGRWGGEAQVAARLSRPFLMSRNELTQAQWRVLSGGANPSARPGCGDACPVEQVSWWSALGYANALSEAEGLPPCYALPTEGCSGSWPAGTLDCGARMPEVEGMSVYACEGYRLPTEAEWEYAARAGTTTATYGGDLSDVTGCVTLSGNGEFARGTPQGDLGWVSCNSGGGPHEVGQKAPNAWGLHDMLGNVWEWTWDSSPLDSPSAAGGTDPRGTDSAFLRTYRGGDWGNDARYMRAATRVSADAGLRDAGVGLRVVRTLPSGPSTDFVRIEPGTFTMGSPAEERGRRPDEAQGSVTLTRAFLMGVAPVTQREWMAHADGFNPSPSVDCGADCPVSGVTWWSTLAYANALSSSEGLTPCYVIPSEGCTGTWQDGTLACGDAMPTVTTESVYTCLGYRLPTEAEWEYAARAGTTTATYGGDFREDLTDHPPCVTLTGGPGLAVGTPLTALAWYGCDSTDASPVRGKLPNAWGLYDMLGNVCSWVWDSYDPTSAAHGTNPQRLKPPAPTCYFPGCVPGRQGVRVLRGGAWGAGADDLRAAARMADGNELTSSWHGFRLVRTVPPAVEAHVVTYDAAGGACAPNTRSVSVGGPYGAPPCTPVRDGFVFQGWTLDGLPVRPETLLGSPTAPTLSADWTEAPYPVGLKHVASKNGVRYPNALSVIGTSVRVMPDQEDDVVPWSDTAVVTYPDAESARDYSNALYTLWVDDQSGAWAGDIWDRMWDIVLNAPGISDVTEDRTREPRLLDRYFRATFQSGGWLGEISGGACVNCVGYLSSSRVDVGQSTAPFLTIWRNGRLQDGFPIHAAEMYVSRQELSHRAVAMRIYEHLLTLPQFAGGEIVYESE